MFTESLHLDEFPRSLKRGVIVTIPKKDERTLCYSKKRPLTMLNMDYKIIAKCYAKRLQVVLGRIISKCQRGFLKGRQSCITLRNLLDLLHYALEYDLDIMLLNLDFEKAFDSVHLDSLYMIMKDQGFLNHLFKLSQCCIQTSLYAFSTMDF